MRGAPGARVPAVLLSCLCSCILGQAVLGKHSLASANTGTATTSAPPPSTGNTSPVTSKMIASPTSTDPTAENTKDTSLPVTSITPVASTVSMTTGLDKQSTLSSSTTSTEQTSASSQDHQTQSMETTRETQTSIITQVTTSTPSSPSSAHKSTEGVSQETSASSEATSSSPSSLSHTPGTTSETLTATTSADETSSPPSSGNTSPVTSKMIASPTSTDPTAENTKDTSLPVTTSITPVAATVSMTTGLDKQSTLSSSATSTEQTTSTPSSPPSAHKSTEGVSQETFPSGKTSTSSPSSSSITPLKTTELFTAPTSTDTTVGSTMATSPSVTTSFPPFTSKVSTTWLSEAQSTLLSTSSSAPKISTVFSTQQSKGTETTGWPYTRSSLSAGISHETFTSDKTTTFTSSFFSGSHTTQSQKEVWSTPVAAPAWITERASAFPASTSWVTSKVSTAGIQKEPTTRPYLSTSQQTTVAVSQTHWTQGTESIGGSHARSTSSRMTEIIKTVTSPPPSSAASAHTSPQTPIHTLSPSGTSTPFISSSVSDSHRTHAATPAWSPGATEGTPTATSITLSDVASRSPPTILSTSGEVLTKTTGSFTHEHMTAGVIHPVGSGNNSLTNTARVPTSSAGESGAPTPEHPVTRPTHVAPASGGNSAAGSTRASPSPPTSRLSVRTSPDTPLAGTTAASQTAKAGRTAAPLPAAASQALTAPAARTSTGARGSAAPAPTEPERGASLFSYGPRAGDQEFVKRTVDFTSPLFKPRIGFPLGSSLRDSLYFTDNGQIIFPESEYQIFSYPNPPLGGFTAWDPVALVAPFWDDADFSSSRGTIFYQEYETLSEEYSLLVREVEASIKTFTNTWNYKARWTLKVTWVRAPSYPAWGTIGANTYQAILSTDGSRSYALFLYQSGGMQWDVTRRPGNPVLMGFSSGDGYFQNSPLTFQPVWEKYRPDQFLDSKAGLRGLQIYKLHREEKPNYRLQCLQWLKRQSQQPSWGWNHTPCPCSWNQGQWDLRFQATNIGWWGPGSRQLCSFSSWCGGVCCRYGPWGELLLGWRVQSPWQFDQELEPQNWCCRFNDKPSLCALYQMRRPRVSCAGYQPPRPAWMFGDPHIVTLDGANYTFNGLGDFLLVRTQDRNSSFLLQGRTAQTGAARATNFIAFAAEYRSSSLDPITVRWLLQPNDAVHVRLGQRSVTFAGNPEGADGQETVSASGVVLTRAGSEVSAAFDGAVTVSVVALSGVLHAACSLPQAYRGRTEGLLGEINGTRLFGKRDDHLPSNFTPVFRSQLSRNKSSDENLTSECHGDERCVFDALATGSKRLGLHTGMLFRRYQRRNTTLNEYPPSVEGPDVVKAYMGQARRVRYTSSAKDVTFTLRNNCADFTLFENGTLLWTPKLLEPCTLEILARSAKDNLSSVLQPRTVVCACRAESQCLYNQTRRVGSSSLEVADCTCDGDTYGRYCNRSKDPCDEPCFPHVTCVPGRGCEACPPSLTGDGRHCAPLGSPSLCGSRACPADYCDNSGRCHVAGNDFPPAVRPELPLRIIQLSLREDENASRAEVNASVAHRLRNLDVQAFLWNRRVDRAEPPAALASGGSLHRWNVISEFQYRAGGPAIDFLNNRLLDAVVEAFLPRAPWRSRKRSAGPRNNVTFHPVSRRDVYSVKALNLSTLETYLQCSGYEGYHLVFSPQSGFTCVSPCGQGYCEHGGQCQHLPDGPRCSWEPFSIYAPWGPRCERLSLRLGAFFGILFGALGALLLLGVVGCVVLRFWGSPRTRFSYPLASDR